MLERHGERRRTEAGEVLFREGDERYDFFVVLEGLVAVVSGYGGDERLLAVHGPGRFLGELGLLTGQAALLHGRGAGARRGAGGAGRAPARADLAGLGAGRPDPARLPPAPRDADRPRRRLHDHRARGFDPDTRRLREFCARNRLPHRWIDVEEDQEAEALLREVGVTPEETPVVIWRGREVLQQPEQRGAGTADRPARRAPPRASATSSWWGPGRPGLRPPSTGRPRAWRRSRSTRSRPVGRRGPRRRSRTTSASRPGSRARSSPSARRSRPRSSARGSACRRRRSALSEEDGHYVVTPRRR